MRFYPASLHSHLRFLPRPAPPIRGLPDRPPPRAVPGRVPGRRAPKPSEDNEGHNSVNLIEAPSPGEIENQSSDQSDDPATHCNAIALML